MRLFAIVILATSVFASGASLHADMLDSALATVGKTRADLGYDPKGYWNRYPFEIPYKLPAFDDLFAEPLRVYDYSQSMNVAFMRYMQDTTFFNQDNSALYQLTYLLAWERKIGGFRNYSANLTDSVWDDAPLAMAVERLYAATGTPLENPAFGAISESAFSHKKLIEMTKQLDRRSQEVLASWVLNVVEAYRYQKLALRNVATSTIAELYEVQDLDETQGDGQKYYPQFDDCAREIDWQSLAYSSFKVIATSDLTAKRLRAGKFNLVKTTLDIPTPLGRIVIGNPGDSHYRKDDYLLICDHGGNDTYESGGSSRPGLPIGVIIDLAGDDVYGDSLSTRSFGYGGCGTGIVIDAAGNDRYLAKKLAQGVGIFGTGLVADFAGKDSYSLKVSGQGCGYFGVGLLFDRDGDDQYSLCGDGQGAGGVGGGIGVLADYTGNDHYYAEPLASVYNRGDYHSEMKINSNNAQGWGGGRRGDGSDGHSWAGGLGALIDCYGDDDYYSGNWSLGIGYWFGIGIVYDVEGNDNYKSCYFTQASGAHYCIGAMFDESGNDKHELYETAGAGISFGWDFAVTLLADWAGNDQYIAKNISIANAQIRSNSFLFDFGGDDLYRLSDVLPGMGESTFRDDYRDPRAISPYLSYAQSFGVLIDIGGRDQYLNYSDSSKTTTTREGCGDGKTWLRPTRADQNFGFDSYGIGIDADSGNVIDLDRYRKPRPNKP